MSMKSKPSKQGIKSPNVSAKDIKEFKELDAKRKSGNMTETEFNRAKEIAMRMKGRAASVGSKTNDISFYNKYPDLLKDASNVIFNEIAGTKLNAYAVSGVNEANQQQLWPTVGTRVEVLPTIGKSVTANDAFNYQMRDLWLQLHRAYRGLGAYEYADLGIVMFAIMSVFADIARAERIYGVASKFVTRNRSMPSALLQALGVDYRTMYAEKLADFRYQLNRAIAKSKILCLPQGFSAFESFIRLFGGVFKDSDDVRAQWIVYDSNYRIDYDPTFTTGGSLVYTPRSTSNTLGSLKLQTLDDVISDINTQLDALLSDTDVARMCSDLLKAFGENGIQGLIPVPENFEIELVRDDVRLQQLHNTVFVGEVIGGGFSSAIFTALGSFTYSYETLRIYQENGVMKHRLYTAISPVAVSLSPSAYVQDATGEYVCGPTNATGKNYQDLIYPEGPTVLDTYQSDPSGDDVVELTRQAVAFTHSSITIGANTYYPIEITDFSIYVVCNIVVFRGCETATAGFRGGTSYSNFVYYDTIAGLEGALMFAGALSKMDWAPRLQVAVKNSGTVTSVSCVWDMDNYSLISREALSRLHDACTLSLFKLGLKAAE